MWLPCLLLLPLAAAWQLSLLHVNDIHARMEETNKYSSPCRPKDAAAGKCYGGLARLATAVKEVKERDQSGEDAADAVVWLYGGDFYQGTLWYTMFKWELVAKMNAMLGFDAMTLGNHEFDDGAEGLEPFLQTLNCPMIVSNMATSNQSGLEGLYKNSTVLLKGGKRIGLVGYLTPDTIVTANVPRDLVLDDEVEALTREVARLRQEEAVDIVIAIGHSGYHTDMKVAREVPGVDIIVGAHSHSFLFTEDAINGVRNPSGNTIEGSYPTVETGVEGNTVLVVQAFAFTKYLGHMEVNFSDVDNTVESWVGAPILLDSSFDKDAAVDAVLGPRREEMDLSQHEVVGETEGLLFISRQVEATIGNIITDAMVEAFKDKRDMTGRRFWMALHNSGGIRTNLTDGPITLGDLMTVLPFESSYDSISLAGRYLRLAFEKSVQAWEEKDGAFLQVSGIRVVYNLEAPVGSRVCRLEVLGDEGFYEDVKEDKIYPLVICKYLADGGDGYFVISENKQDHQIGDMDTDVVRGYLAAHSPVRPRIGGRIIMDNNCTVIA